MIQGSSIPNPGEDGRPAAPDSRSHPRPNSESTSDKEPRVISGNVLTFVRGVLADLEFTRTQQCGLSQAKQRLPSETAAVLEKLAAGKYDVDEAYATLTWSHYETGISPVKAIRQTLSEQLRKLPASISENEADEDPRFHVVQKTFTLAGRLDPLLGKDIALLSHRSSWLSPPKSRGIEVRDLPVCTRIIAKFDEVTLRHFLRFFGENCHTSENSIGIKLKVPDFSTLCRGLAKLLPPAGRHEITANLIESEVITLKADYDTIRSKPLESDDNHIQRIAEIERKRAQLRNTQVLALDYAEALDAAVYPRSLIRTCYVSALEPIDQESSIRDKAFRTIKYREGVVGAAEFFRRIAIDETEPSQLRVSALRHFSSLNSGIPAELLRYFLARANGVMAQVATELFCSYGGDLSVELLQDFRRTQFEGRHSALLAYALWSGRNDKLKQEALQALFSTCDLTPQFQLLLGLEKGIEFIDRFDVYRPNITAAKFYNLHEFVTRFSVDTAVAWLIGEGLLARNAEALFSAALSTASGSKAVHKWMSDWLALDPALLLRLAAAAGMEDSAQRAIHLSGAERLDADATHGHRYNLESDYFFDFLERR